MRDRLIEEPNYCDYCFNFDKEHIGMDGTAVCKLTNKIVYSEDGGDCPFFNVPKERIIVPPCKVGETVYYIHETYWDKNYKDYIETKELKEDVVQIVECPELKTNLMLEVKEFDWDLFNNWIKGEVFLTKAEAEQKLKEMRGGNADTV